MKYEAWTKPYIIGRSMDREFCIRLYMEIENPVDWFCTISNALHYIIIIIICYEYHPSLIILKRLISFSESQ